MVLLVCFRGQPATESLSTWPPDVHSSWGTTAEASGAQAACHCLDFEEGQEGMLLQPGQTCHSIYKHRQLLDLAVSPSPRANRGWEGNPPNQDPLSLLPCTGVSV